MPAPQNHRLAPAPPPASGIACCTEQHDRGASWRQGPDSDHPTRHASAATVTDSRPIVGVPSPRPAQHRLAIAKAKCHQLVSLLSNLCSAAVRRRECCSSCACGSPGRARRQCREDNERCRHVRRNVAASRRCRSRGESRAGRQATRRAERRSAGKQQPQRHRWCSIKPPVHAGPAALPLSELRRLPPRSVLASSGRGAEVSRSSWKFTVTGSPV
jgi:hypothetical protein